MQIFAYSCSRRRPDRTSFSSKITTQPSCSRSLKIGRVITPPSPTSDEKGLRRQPRAQPTVVVGAPHMVLSAERVGNNLVHIANSRRPPLDSRWQLSS